MNLMPNGRSYDLFCLIKTISEKTNKNGDRYLDLTISDNDGEMNAKLWSYDPTQHGNYSAGDIVKLRGAVTQYNGQDQMRIDKIRPVFPEDKFDYSSVIPSAEYDGEEMMKAIYGFLDEVEDTDLKKLTGAILREAESRMLYWPAAFRLHHAMRGGLLYHTLSILKTAKAVIEIYPSVNKDFLFCGAILHDVCKIDEFEVNALGIVKKYSQRGELIGHLVMGAMRISEKAKELGIDQEKAMLLEHMIISHHGTPEFGSPIRPMTLEAIVLSQLDTLDAVIYEVEDAVRTIKPGEFTDRQWALDNRKLFNPGLNDISTKAELL